MTTSLNQNAPLKYPRATLHPATTPPSLTRAMNPDFWILWIPFLVLVVMLSVALASLRFVEKKQEIQDEKLDELECQLARLENRLESRFKLPDVDPSTLDKEYMTLDEMEREASRLLSLIAKRDIPDKESILKRLDDWMTH